MGILLTGLLVLGACTFEPRGDGNGGEEPEALPILPTETGPASSAADSSAAVLQVVRTFREATTVGDLSLALALTDPDARLEDELGGELPRDHTRGELLLELRSRLGGDLHLREEAAEVSFPGGVAVVFSFLVLEGEGEPPEELSGLSGRRLRETVVLVSGERGWRIRHLHRSIAPDPR